MLPSASRFRFDRRTQAFSLIEVAMALGIVAFAFTALLGMIPVGLGLFRSAVDSSVTTRIVQRVSSDLQQSDFDLIDSAEATILYFDEQGNRLTSANRAIYWARVNIYADAPLPGSTGASPSDIARIVIQVAHNPGSTEPLSDADGAWQEQDGIRLIKRSFFLARNTPQAGA